MTSLFERFQSLFDVRRRTPVVSGPYIDGEEQKVPDPAGIVNPGDIFTASGTDLTQNTGEQDRVTRYGVFDTMDVGDVEAVLDAIVDAAVTFEDEPGVCFKVEGKTRSAVAVTDMTYYAQVHMKLPQAIRDMVKYGDAFVEIISSNEGVLGIQTYDPAFIYVNVDERGRINPNRAFVQYNSSGEEVASWKKSEMVHLKFRESDRSAYSPRGLLDGIQTDWENLIRMEQGMVIARLTRAYPRNVHKIDTTNKAAADAKRSIAAYIKAVTKQTPTQSFDGNGFNAVTRTDMAVNEDYFLTTGYIQAPNGTLEKKMHDIELLDPSLDGLGDLADVEYIRRKMFARIPADIVGIPSQYVDLASQHVSYARLIKKVQQATERALRLIFLQELLLRGLALDDLVVIWPNIQSGQTWKFQEAKYRQALTEQVEIETGTFSRKYILMHRHNIAEEDAEEILTEIEEEKRRMGAIMAPQSRASQIGQGDTSGDTEETPAVSDLPSAETNRQAQTGAGAGGQNATK